MFFCFSSFFFIIMVTDNLTFLPISESVAFPQMNKVLFFVNVENLS